MRKGFLRVKPGPDDAVIEHRGERYLGLPRSLQAKHEPEGNAFRVLVRKRKKVKVYLGSKR